MNIDRFGRAPEQAKADQRRVLDGARAAYPEYVNALNVGQNTPERSDIHELIDRGMLQRHQIDDSRGVVGDPSLVSMYRLTAYGHDMLRRPHWLDATYPSVVNVTAVASSVNVGSPGATANTQVSLLVRLRSEVESAQVAPEEKSRLLQALDVLLKSATIASIVAKLIGGG